ncbi:sarcosine oxidase subunit beta [Allocatelliglobosispora scoriae]|uniref:Sarcosine oxidase subunit beta n=1 Tax=Allocatelliglobosispora scoriae TaxID=643052 RepID=A0A841BN83_9ACTN|nr:FAD-binding oxidoreductase [Allocatelliglobosispora scoriae]MBB5868649.1 sarcosine oxidase subunit beta [Allocatelliglobosispora scoriae]
MTDADVVVVGGGIIGVSCAYHLAAAGVRVTLVERDTLGAGSTSKAAGGARSAYTTRVNLEMGLHGIGEYAGFRARFGQEIDFHRMGYLFLIADAADLPEFERCSALQREYGIRSHIIGAEEAQRISPLISTDGIVAALWSPDDAKATPDAVVQGYARAARGHGARLLTGVEVTGIELDGGVVRGVRTGRGLITAGTVVVAAGAWSGAVGAMAGVDLPVVPIRRQVVFTGPVDGLGETPLTIEMPTTLYFHREGPGLAVSYSDHDRAPGFDTRYEPGEWLDRLVELIGRRAPAILDAGIRSAWAGLYEVTPDHNQIIGEVPGMSRVLYAAGFSGHGFQMGPAAGAAIRDLYLGAPQAIDISSLDVRRFRGGIALAEHNIV